MDNLKEKQFRKYLSKVMRRKANQGKDWLSFDLDSGIIRLYSKIRGNEWNVTIEDFKLINPE